MTREVLKLGATLAIVLAVGAAIITLDASGQVAEAEADLWDIFSQERRSHEVFTDVLRREGMSAPRQYNFNGNDVYFAYATTRETPREVMYRFQEAFVMAGLNQHFHPGIREPAELEDRDIGNEEDVADLVQAVLGATDLFRGGMVPIEDTRNTMRMVGVETRDGARSLAELIAETEGATRPPEEVFTAIRYLDATREEGSLVTTITAVWGDHQELNRFLPGALDVPLAIEGEIPLCDGCQRVTRFSGTGGEEGMHNFLFRSRRSLQEVTGYYDRTMGSYGWELEPAFRGLMRLQRQGYAPDTDAQVRAFKKGGLHLTLMVYDDPADDFTYVKIITTR